MRDSQRQKVYNAEAEALGTDADPALATVAGMEAALKRILKSKWWEKRYPRIRYVEVHDGRGARRGKGGWNYWKREGYIRMPKWCRGWTILLHELAHVICAATIKEDFAWHGWQHCQTMLALTRRWVGVDAHDRLKRAYKQHRCRVRPKRTRTISPELRERYAASMAKVNAAKKKRAGA